MDMDFTWIITCCLVLSISSLVSTAQLPEGITACHRSDPDIDNCIQRAIEQAVYVFRNGYEELNIRRLEPFLVPELVLVQSKTSENFHLSLSFRNLYIRGVTAAQFDNFRVHVGDDQIIIRGHVYFPQMLFDGMYELVGKLLLFPLDGNDKAHMEMTKIGGNMTLVLEATEVNGVEYLEVKDTIFSLTPPERVSMRYENLVKGNPQLSDDMNRILEESVPALQEIFRPSIEKFFTKLFKGAAIKVFSVIPMDLALPP